MLTLDAESLYADLRARLQPEADQGVRLVGVASGGAWLAQRLHADLKLAGEPGVVSSAMHRDDFASRGLAASAHQTRLPFEVDGAHLMLIDDVLYTGRTLRAVLNELFDFGRPASVRLAVLVDRGGRQLPIEAWYAAARVSLQADQSLALARAGDGRFTFEVVQER
jgi:pyrimidine operon attenuation protein/uracil phosphoribosyltransferase